MRSLPPVLVVVAMVVVVVVCDCEKEIGNTNQEANIKSSARQFAHRKMGEN